MFSWIEDTEGCDERPDGTYVTLFTFADNSGQPTLCADDNVVLKTDETSVPENFTAKSVAIDEVFYNPD